MDEIKQEPTETLEKARPDELAKNWAITILVVVTVVAVGLFALNQFVDWKYHGTFLAGPCQLCVELNPEVGQCWEMRNRLDNSQYNYYEKNYSSFFANLNKSEN